MTKRNTLYLPPQPQPRPSDNVHPVIWQMLSKIIAHHILKKG
jgi:hypothetical protein